MEEKLSNKTCGECRGFSESENRCLLLGGRGKAYADNEACRRFSEKKPIPSLTNGDVIRQGGDEALMLFKKKHKCDCCVYLHNGNCTEPVDKKDRCEYGLKQWLNAPADCVGKDTDVLTKESEGEDE